MYTSRPMSAEPVRTGVVGCGYLGRHHARILADLDGSAPAGFVEPDDAKAGEIESAYGAKGMVRRRSVAELLGAGATAVVVASPTSTHAAVAEELLAGGADVMVEKPVTATLDEADRLVAVAREGRRVLQVGHIERFNPAFVAVRKMNIQPRFIEVTRISPLTFRSIDVGVVLDMMIHDIDLVLQLAHSKVAKIDAVGVSVIGDVEDICNARVTFENGCVANITASRLAMKTERRIRVFSADAYLSVDYQKRYGMVAKRSDNVSAIRDAVARIRSGEITDITQLNFMDLVNLQELQIDEADPLKAQLESFLDAATGKCDPQVTAEEGLAAVSLATRIVQSITPQTLA